MFLTATNGKAMAITSELGHVPESQALAIPSKIADRGKTKRDKVVRLSGETWCDGKKIEDATPGLFPDISRAIPDRDSLEGYHAVTINVDLLADLLNAVARRGGERHVNLMIKNNDSPVLVEEDGNIGVLMTMTRDKHRVSAQSFYEASSEYRLAWDKCDSPKHMQSRTKEEKSDA